MATSQASMVGSDANRGPKVVHTVVPVAVLATISVACRLYSRKLKRSPFASHDYLIVGGLILAWGCAAITIISKSTFKHLLLVLPPALCSDLTWL